MCHLIVSYGFSTLSFRMYWTLLWGPYIYKVCAPGLCLIVLVCQFDMAWCTMHFISVFIVERNIQEVPHFHQAAGRVSLEGVRLSVPVRCRFDASYAVVVGSNVHASFLSDIIS